MDVIGGVAADGFPFGISVNRNASRGFHIGDRDFGLNPTENEFLTAGRRANQESGVNPSL